MGRKKSKYQVYMNLRVTALAKAWAEKQVPERCPSYSAYVTDLILDDKERLRKSASERERYVPKQP